MTLLSRFFSLFPAFTLMVIVAALVLWAKNPSLVNFGLLVFSIYGFPLCAFRLINLFYPLREGNYRLDERKYSSWWGSHQIQLLYIAVPQLESILRLVPGLFSIWLRLWGSKVGKSIYWTPQVEIMDRSLMEIGDRVIFGHKVFCSSHVVKQKSSNIVLSVKKIRIGERALIGAGSNIGPGVTVASEISVPVKTDLYPNVTFDQEGIHEAQKVS